MFHSNHQKFLTKRGLSLVEMMVVVIIILLIFIILIPAVNKARRAAVARKCLNTARQIATAVRTHATADEGWTPFDRSYYLKLLGYKLITEKGYFDNDGPGWNRWNTPSRRHARAIKNFWCPLDKAPKPTQHEIASSYEVMLVGESLMSLESPDNTLLVREIGKRHLSKKKTLSQHLVFADLHAQLGANNQYLKGLDVRWWRSGYYADFNQAKIDELEKEPEFRSLWANSLSESKFNFLPKIGAWSSSSDPNYILLRMDGSLVFPKAGPWYFISNSRQRIFIWLDLNSNDKQDPGETAVEDQPSITKHLMTIHNIQMSKQYKFALVYIHTTGSQHLNLYWTQDPLAETEPAFVTKALVPPSALFFKP